MVLVGLGGRSRALVALTVIVALEALLLVVATIWLIFELFVDTPESMTTAIALIVTVGVLAVGVGLLAVGLVRRARGVRGGVVVWQILQIAVAVGAFQGAFARQDVGWALLAPAIVALVLVLSPAVTGDLLGDASAHPNSK